MKIETSNFGQIEINPVDVISFPLGIPAFEHLREFIIISYKPESSFFYLQSVEEGELTFVLAEPLAFFPDYRVSLAKNDLRDIGIQEEDEAVVLVMVTIPDEPQKMTANLQAPLIINEKNKLGKQVILSESNYSTRHRLFRDEKLQASK